MTREELFAYIKSEYGAEPEYLWEGDTRSAVFRHGGNRKWFALAMTIKPERLSLSGDTMLEVMNLKIDPDMGLFLRETPGIYPAYHMSKKHWITVRLDILPKDTLESLIEQSFVMTDTRKKPQKTQKGGTEDEL